MNSSKILLLSLLLIFFSTGLNASENNYEALDSGIVALKKEVLSLNRELRILEENLHFSSNTRFSIFLSMKTGLKSNLESVQLQIDEKNIAHHFYTKSELASLNRGGVQRLYTANLSSGKHEIVAVFSGVSLNGEDYRRDQKIVIDKTSKPQFVEFTIDRGISKKHPAFSVMAWK